MEVHFQSNPPADEQAEFNFDKSTEPYVVELKKRWEAEVEQKYGETWANGGKRTKVGSSCGGNNSTAVKPLVPGPQQKDLVAKRSVSRTDEPACGQASNSASRLNNTEIYSTNRS